MKGLGIMKNRKIKKLGGGGGGFTLIEVVLVLAIGGLIFLLAFVAFQNASTNRRDTQRRNDVNRMVSEVQNYASDHNSAIPTAAVAGNAGSGGSGTNFNQFVVDYMGGANFKGPKGRVYAIGTTPAKPNNTNDGTVVYTYGSGAACDTTKTLGPKDFKIQLGLEKGTVCRDSL